MRIRPLSFVAPVAIAGSLLLAAPPQALAANGMTETGTTTYEVVPGKNAITVTIKLSIYNGKPSSASYYYFWNATEIAVEKEAGAVSATSNAGRVSQSTIKTDQYYRYIKLTYPDVFYGQTRVVTATYTIPAGPHAPGGFRASSAYASLCAVGNGTDTGSVSIVLPAGFDLYVDLGNDLPNKTTTGPKQVYSSGNQATPYKFWSCVDAEATANLTHTSLTAGGQSFDIQSWPEDTTWKTAIQEEVGAYVPRLEDLTGLEMPGGKITISEAGDLQLGEYGGLYNSATSTASIPESAEPSVVAHELSHVWFNRKMFTDKWMSEGLAGYSEKAAGDGNYKACVDPGAFPGSGSPDLTQWVALGKDSTKQDENVLDWEYSAACFAFTTLADAMGPDGFRAVLEAAAANEMAYIGVQPGEQLEDLSLPITANQMLDLIDERGMFPAGVTDLDQAQDLLGGYGVFLPTSLSERSAARADYHALATSAGKWKLPLAIRGPMSTWDFVEAETTMSIAGQVLDVGASIVAMLPTVSLDGSIIQRKFETAATKADLEAVLALANTEAEAARKVDEATKLSEGGKSILQSIGLLGAELDTPLKGARADLLSVKPDTATAQAQTVIDLVNGSSSQGILRACAVGGGLALLLLVIGAIFTLRRRKPAIAPIGPDGAAVFGLPTAPGQWPPAAPPTGYDPYPGALLGQPPAPPTGQWQQQPTPTSFGQWPPAPPAGRWQQPPAPPAGQWPPAADPAPWTDPRLLGLDVSPPPHPDAGSEEEPPLS